MIRYFAAIIPLIGLLGCAARSATAPTSAGRAEAVSATALAFDPPITADVSMLSLDRTDRGPVAFLGFENPVTTYFYLRVDDRFTTDWTNRYERRAIIESVGVSYR